ncbi:hypothetical protein ES703_79254 [subsurface metagenome]
MAITLDKALEILNLIPVPLVTATDHDTFDALNLGMQGLIRLRDCRQRGRSLTLLLLPGEIKPL